MVANRTLAKKALTVLAAAGLLVSPCDGLNMSAGSIPQHHAKEPLPKVGNGHLMPWTTHQQMLRMPTVTTQQSPLPVILGTITPTVTASPPVTRNLLPSTGLQWYRI